MQHPPSTTQRASACSSPCALMHARGGGVQGRAPTNTRPLSPTPTHPPTRTPCHMTPPTPLGGSSSSGGGAVARGQPHPPAPLTLTPALLPRLHARPLAPLRAALRAWVWAVAGGADWGLLAALAALALGERVALSALGAAVGGAQVLPGRGGGVQGAGGARWRRGGMGDGGMAAGGATAPGPPPRRALPLLPASPPPSPVAEQLTFNTAPNPFLFVPMARKAKAGPSTSARKAKPRGGRFIDPVKNLHEQYLRKLQISTMLSRRDPYPPFDERERILKPYNDRVSDAILAVRRERPDYTWEDIDAITKFVVDQFYANQIPPE